MSRVVFFSEHVYQSQRRAGFHWLADAYLAAGWDAIFVTVGLSPLSRLKNDYRMALVKPHQRNRFVDVRPGLRAFAWYPPFHPLSLRMRFANRLSQALFSHYGDLDLGILKRELHCAASIIVESASGLALVPRLRALAPEAHLVYRVSDSVEVIGAHPVLREFEQQAIPYFDLISVPSELLVSRFPRDAPVVVHPHGIQKALFDVPSHNPYPPSYLKNIVAVGSTLFDGKAVGDFARSAPNVGFHLFGSLPRFSASSNVRLYGERPFVELIPYLQNADAGLAPYRWKPGCEYLAYSSNKVLQYTYCRLPVLLPYYIPNRAQHVIPYRTGNEADYRNALQKAFMIDRRTIDRSGVPTWDDVREEIEKRANHS